MTASGSEPLVMLEQLPVSDRGEVAALVTLNRPASLNAVDSAMIAALDDALDRIESSPEVRAVLVTGAGRAFCAGGDLKGYIALQKDPVAFPAFVEALHDCFLRLQTLPVPVVALVNGDTAAGGLELVLNCDLAYASSTARIGDGHLNFGQMGGGGVLTLLPRRIGIARAAELLYSGRLLPAEDAAALGLVNRVVGPDDLLEIGLDFARQVATKSPLAVRNAKAVMNGLWIENGSVEAGLRYEQRAQRLLLPHLPRRGRGAQGLLREATTRVPGLVMSIDLDPSLAHGDRDSRAFWSAVRDGRLLLQRCSACRRARFPAMPGCPYCGSPDATEEAASGRGTVYSWITVHRALDADHADEVPYSVRGGDPRGRSTCGWPVRPRPAAAVRPAGHAGGHAEPPQWRAVVRPARRGHGRRSGPEVDVNGTTAIAGVGITELSRAVGSHCARAGHRGLPERRRRCRPRRRLGRRHRQLHGDTTRCPPRRWPPRSPSRPCAMRSTSQLGGQAPCSPVS